MKAHLSEKGVTQNPPTDNAGLGEGNSGSREKRTRCKSRALACKWDVGRKAGSPISRVIPLILRATAVSLGVFPLIPLSCEAQK